MQHHVALLLDAMGKFTYVAPAGQYSLKDKFNAFAVCWLLGIGCMFSWNSMLIIEDYYVSLFPGGPGVGTGNFEEVGPLDKFLKPRNTTWLQVADLLFVQMWILSLSEYMLSTPVKDELVYLTN